MSKRFGALNALDDVSIQRRGRVLPRAAGRERGRQVDLVKCVMGFYEPDAGTILLDGPAVRVRTPRDARALGIGMVYQHFTLVPSLTAAENLVIARADAPSVIDWGKEKRRLKDFLDGMPFRVPLDAPVSSLAAGEKQKLEILKLLYLEQRFMILDEPTSVLTPAEADEILGLLKGMAGRGEITVLMITHKFREVNAYADAVTVLRRGRKVGAGRVGAMSTEEMARAMIGDAVVRERAVRVGQGRAAHRAGAGRPVRAGRRGAAGARRGEPEGPPRRDRRHRRRIGQRAVGAGRVPVRPAPARRRAGVRPRQAVRAEPGRLRPVQGVRPAEEPLKNAAVPRMTVAENIAFRTFDRPPTARFGWWLRPGPMRERARDLIDRYKIKTPSAETPIENLSAATSSAACSPASSRARSRC
jgi:simple sugar transport system ATP-binding protein